MSRWALWLVAGLISGCSTYRFENNPQNGEGGTMVLYEYPREPYRSLGVIDIEYFRFPWWRAPMVYDALPYLKKRVDDIGGNALIIRGQRLTSWSYIVVSAEVLAVEYAKPAPLMSVPTVPVANTIRHGGRQHAIELSALTAERLTLEAGCKGAIERLTASESRQVYQASCGRAGYITVICEAGDCQAGR